MPVTKQQQNPSSSSASPSSVSSNVPCMNPKGVGAASAALAPICYIEIQADGSGLATVPIPSDVLARMQRRAGPQDLGEYAWSNIFRAALYSHVY